MFDLIMDSALKRICKALGADSDNQSVINLSKSCKLQFDPVAEKLSFCSNSRIQICDSLNVSLTRRSQKSV